MKLAVQAVGKNACSELGRGDLVTVDRDLAEFAGVRYARIPRRVELPASADRQAPARDESRPAWQ